MAHGKSWGNMDYFLYNTDGGQGRFQVLIKKSIAATSGEYTFGEQLGKLKIGDILLMYENKRGIVAIGKTLEQWNGKAYKTPLYYIPGIEFPEGASEYRIKVNWFHDISDSPFSIEEMKKHIGYIPRGAVKPFIKWRAEVKKIIAELMHRNSVLFPDDIPEKSKGLPEGAKKSVLVNAYERSNEARRQCIEHWGYNCQLCGILLEDFYDSYGSSFIHVHHRIPLSQIKKSYIVDPIKDMLPICPNCHAILHRIESDNPIGELRKIIKKKAGKSIHRKTYNRQ